MRAAGGKDNSFEYLSDTENYSPVTEKAIFYIRNHLDTSLSLRKVSNACAINASYLSDIFRRDTGTTITDYIQTLRIVEACNLLLTTGNSVSEIAMTVGFSDSNYFTKLFCKYVHMSPTAFRALLNTELDSYKKKTSDNPKIF